MIGYNGTSYIQIYNTTGMRHIMPREECHKPENVPKYPTLRI